MSGAVSLPIEASELQSWDECRKAARKVETQIFSKLLDYNKITQPQHRLSHSIQANNATDDEKAALLHNKADHLQEQLENELNALLQRLTQLNESLSQLLSMSDSSVNTESNQYTLSRNQAILHDYTAEFKRIQHSINSHKHRQQLLNDSNRSNNNQLRTRTDQLLREKSSIQQSLKLTDDAIQQALDSRESLHHQSSILKSASRRLVILTRRLPLVNSLMSNITTAKQREMIVLGVLIGGLMCFTLLYITNKA